MADTKKNAIRVEGVSKTFKLPHEKHTSVKGLFMSMFKGRRTYEKQRVLKDVSFEVKEGDFFGIVGRNGSGKSTLLKLISGIYTPDKGHIQINGKLVPFIELGVGFNPELTGRENVFLNGALLGFNRKEMLAMYDEIVEFAELEKFMDQKLKNYSSGMQVRLAFSIAIRAKGDVLVLDEVLAVGDAAFQQKCQAYFEELKRDGRTVVLVTHDMGSVERYCNRALLIENGEIKSIGSPAEIAKQYTLDNMASEGKSNNSSKRLDDSIELLDIELVSNKTIAQEDKLSFNVYYKLRKSVGVELGISVIRNGQSVIEHNTKEISIGQAVGKKYCLNYTYDLDQLNPGRYEVAVAIFRRKGFNLIGFNTGGCSFIIDGEKRGGVLKRRGSWSIIK